MTDPSFLDTLFHTLDAGLKLPEGPRAFLYAGAHARMKLLAAGGPLDCRQPFFPAAQTLAAAGYDVRPATDDLRPKSYACIVVALPKQVEEAKGALAQAIAALRPGGLLIACANNDANGNRIIGWLAEKNITGTSYSKNRARCVTATIAESVADLSDWRAAAATTAVDFGDGLTLESRPGVFSWNRADPGSEFLLQFIPPDITGVAADFGCGIGFLSHHLLAQQNAIAALHIVDADNRALILAKANMDRLHKGADVRAHWADLAHPVPDLPPLDFIIMNPPFHKGKLSDSSLGQAFIGTAAHHLKKDGRLLMVANAHLPYEEILNKRFSRVTKLAEAAGYKIYGARK